MRAVLAGVSYFALIFGLGFALGTLRVLALEPRLGSTGAVLLELPVMLTASWVLCGWLIRRLKVPGETGARLAMGSTAFALLMLAELGLSVFLLGRSPAEHLAAYRSFNAMLGLAGQIGFAAMPLFRRGDPSPLGSSAGKA